MFQQCIYCKEPIDNKLFKGRYWFVDRSVRCPHCDKAQDPVMDFVHEWSKIIGSILLIILMAKCSLMLS